MINSIKSQFKASLLMLENAIKLCPEEHWDTSSGFWHIAYHCLFWTDHYLTQEPTSFQIIEPFTLTEFDPVGKKPEKIYSKSELLNYLIHCRNKVNKLLDSLDVDKLNHRWMNEYKDYCMLEIILYNMRHIQHHTAQLNLILRQALGKAGGWVSQA